MKRKTIQKIVFGLISTLIITTSCTTTRIATLTPSENEKIELYASKLPERDYLEICYIETSGAIFHTPQNLLNGLKKKATTLQADAIIDIKYDFQSWYPIASGIAVKYKQ